MCWKCGGRQHTCRGAKLRTSSCLTCCFFLNIILCGCIGVYVAVGVLCILYVAVGVLVYTVCCCGCAGVGVLVFMLWVC